MLDNFIVNLLIFLCMLLSVAFITIAERKVMGSMQRRIGPNYVGYYGLLQAIADAVKLVVKETILPQDSSKLLFYISPVLTLIFSLLLWAFVPISKGVFIYDHEYSILMSLAIGSLSIFGIIFAGWSANSKYSFLGSIRSTAQLISYEVVLSSTIILIMLSNRSLNFIKIIESQEIIYNIVILFPIFIIFLISIIAETNRTPFDLPEAESELVSGFNTEHGATIFVMFFLAEYSNILYWSTQASLLFFGGYNLHLDLFSNILYNLFTSLILGLKASFFVFVYIWVRATLPRLKYNQLMDLCWNKFIPWVFSLLIYLPILIYLF